MKKTTLLLCLVYALFFSCSEDEQPQAVEKEKVQFSLNVATETSDGRVSAAIPAGSVASVEIAGPSGTITENLPILIFGESYLTDPLELPTGSHKLISFLILDENNEVLFAAPKEGSPLSPAVNNPLPQSFNVHKGKIKNVQVQVIEVGEQSPAAFGYASFGIEVVNPLAVTIFIEEEGALVMTDASGYIQAGDIPEPLQQFELAPKVNYISFIGYKDQPYFLTIDKAGYKSVSKQFTYDALGANPSITFVLEKAPAVSFRLDVQAYESQGPLVGVFRFGMSEAGSITVDWGDGTVETKDLIAGNDFEVGLHHYYSEEIYSASVTFTGDLAKVTKFVGTNSRYHNLAVLPNLEHFSDFRSDLNPIALDSLDLSQNFKLQSINIDEGDYDLILGANKTDLIRFWFRGAFRQNQIIPAIEEHIVSNNIQDGIIEIFYSPYPAGTNLEILKGLRDNYGWYVGYNYEAL
jgi:hypothetical protein